MMWVIYEEVLCIGKAMTLTQLTGLVVDHDEMSQFTFNFLDIVFPASILCLICSQSLLRKVNMD